MFGGHFLWPIFLKKQNEITDFIFPSMRVFILQKPRTLDIKVFVKSGSLMLGSSTVVKS